MLVIQVSQLQTLNAQQAETIATLESKLKELSMPNSKQVPVPDYAEKAKAVEQSIEELHRQAEASLRPTEKNKAK